MSANRSLFELQGRNNDVSESFSLSRGLYIVEYEYIAADEMPLLTISIESIEDETDSALVSENAGAVVVGQSYKGRQKARLEGGRYVMEVSPNGATPWRVRILAP
jgi:hypothetical protein